MKDIITIEINKFGIYKLKNKTKLLSIVKSLNLYDDVIAATVDSDLVDLNFIIDKDCKIDFLYVKDRSGSKVYIAGLKFILTCAVKDVFGNNAVVKTEHSIDKGIYCSLEINRDVNENDIMKLKRHMRQLIQKDLPITRVNASTISVSKYFSSINEQEKVEFYDDYDDDTVTMYKLEKYYNYFYNRMPTRTGIISEFDLFYIKENKFVLAYPRIGFKVPEFNKNDNIIKVFEDYSKWIEVLNVSYIPSINKLVSKSKIEEFIQLNEINQNNKLMEIVDNVIKNVDKIKVVLIGGPSSSGKTTTANKTSMYFKTKGVNPFVISVDDYYKDKTETPKDKDGKYNYETIEAIDTDLFNNHLKALLDGKSVNMPTFNFKKGKKEFNEKPSKLKKDDIIIIEGLHTMNEELTKLIPRENKYKIYISPFTPLSVDRHNHISTLDVRLIRRIVRDNQFRGNGPSATLSSWSKVREGEEKYVFPYSDDADVIFNTALIYELGVLKIYAEPLLHSVKKSNLYYLEARRLIGFLKSFYPVPAEYVPKDSILREFIGNGYFN